jgi:acetylornithine deacetylase
VGGALLSRYPARCTMGVERRTLPGETAADVEGEIGELVAAATAASPGLEASQRTLLVREPFEVAHDAAVVEAVGAAAGEVLGAPPPLAGAPYWADAAFIAAAGIPTVMFGASGTGAHAIEEWVSVEDTVKVVRTLIAAAGRLCA